jgi:uncharacterized protein
VGRIVLLLIIAFAIYLLIRGFSRSKVKRDEDADTPPKSSRGEDMVQCTRCGVNLPRSEAHLVAGRLVCHENPRCRGPE